jgi:glyoxylase-like metal-dependent hydrolase (beta-lactamase superfamily II)/rhodanese-related sulfurtransferase
MLFRELNRGNCKTYVVACEGTRRAALIDPVRERVDRYLAFLAYHGFQLELAIDTHTHADHRTGTWDLGDLTGARTVMHERAPAPNIDVHVHDGEHLALGDLELLVLSTPGHSADGMSLHVGDRVFTGDSLLIHGTGRTDFPGGDPAAEYDGIHEKLFSLPDATLVFPGHDYRGHTHSTIGEEKRTNPRLAGRTREEYVRLMNGLALPLPEKIQEALQANQSSIEDDSVRFPPLSQLSQVGQLAPREVHAALSSPDPPLLIDVRQPDEYSGELGHIPGSRPIPLRELAARVEEIACHRAKEIVCVCRAGVRSATAAAMLTGIGFEHVRNMKGGMLDWNDARLPVER